MKFDLQVSENCVLSLTRPSFHNAEVILLKGDVYHINEDDNASFQIRAATNKEWVSELETRTHRAQLHRDPKEMVRT